MRAAALLATGWRTQTLPQHGGTLIGLLDEARAALGADRANEDPMTQAGACPALLLKGQEKLDLESIAAERVTLDPQSARKQLELLAPGHVGLAFQGNTERRNCLHQGSRRIGRSEGPFQINSLTAKLTEDRTRAEIDPNLRGDRIKQLRPLTQLGAKPRQKVSEREIPEIIVTPSLSNGAP